MNARSTALVISFASVAIILNVIKIPVIYWPENFYQLFEIPIVVSFILFGVKIGVLVATINLTGQLAFYLISPVNLVTYPIGFLATLLLLSGVYLASRFIKHRQLSLNPLNSLQILLCLTGCAILSRGLIMPFFDFATLRYFLMPIVFGIDIPEVYLVSFVPAFIFFNITMTLLIVPVAYVVSSKVSKVLKIEPKLI